MSAVEAHPHGNLADVVCELDMIAAEVACLPTLRAHLDADCWPVDERIRITLENIAAHTQFALSSIRERDERELAVFERMTEARN
ncbi:MAG: hypothetical protein AB7Q42_05985 [Acidimicrobiia bacterium]